MLTYSVIDEALGLTSIYNDDNEDLSPYIIETTCVAISGEKHYMYGKSRSEEWKKAMSEKLKGVKKPNYNNGKKRATYSHRNMPKGILKSEDHKRKISETNKRKGINFVNNGATEAARLVNTGRKLTKEHIEKRSSKRRKPVLINNVLYASGREAAERLGVSPSAITSMIKNGKAIKYDRHSESGKG
jgi:hypothetical protein